MSGLLKRLGAIAIVLLFAVVLVDYLVVRQIGVRLVPVDYLTLRRAFYVLGFISAAIGILAYRKPARDAEGFFRMDVAWYRLVVLFCGAPMLATIVGFLGRFSWLADLFAHFRVQYVALLVLGALVLVVLRQRRWAALVAGFAFVNVLVVAPHFVPWPAARADGDTEIRFVAANVNIMNEDSGTLLTFLDDMDADVILLGEINARWMRDLDPLNEDYPHHIAAPQRGAFGIALFSRLPLSSSEVVHLVDERIPSIVATLDADGTAIRFVGTHPLRPRDGASAASRDAQLRAIGELAAEADSLVVVMGDLNTTPWGYSFRDLVSRSGLVDSSLGMGPQWSWPAQFWPLAIPIDHGLVSEKVRVIDRFIGPHIGSDHYPLVLDVSW